MDRADVDHAGPAKTAVPPTSLSELACFFLKLGFTAFGGPAAHVALMKAEVVTRREWMTEADFLDLLGAANLIPGPSSTEMAIYIGFRRGSWPGLVLAGVCFILPAALLVSGCAWAYVHFGALPQMAAVLYGIKPVMIAIVLQAVWDLGKTAIKTRLLACLGVFTLALALLGFDPLRLLFGAGALFGVLRWVRPHTGQDRPSLRSLLVLLFITAVMVLIPTALTSVSGRQTGVRLIPFSLASLFLFFLKVGATLYGSGYLLLAFLRDGLVNQWHWMTGAQLLDATAIGQVTPGPVFTTATFIGYLLGGPIAAFVATFAIFLPSFIFVALSGPLIPRLRRSPLTSAFLDGVNVAALALMLAVTRELAHAALVDPLTVILALISTVLLVRYRINSALLIVGAAVIGILTSL